ncbi:MAG: acid phosphatase [Calditrichaeota bacterium]|nr:MAG: acid phosphatase [Calditrichota bacterium]
MKKYLLLALTLFFVQNSFAQNDNFNATLWTQVSAEFRALTLQTYKNATKNLESALKDKNWSAEISQREGFEDLTPCVILDIDETVLDNSNYQGQLVLDNSSYATKTWDKWIKMAKATEVKGALNFVKEAKEMGITVFYLTNRKCIERDDLACPQELETIKNLETLGFPKVKKEEILLRYEREEWGSEKISRRQEIAKDYRVLMLFGDDLGDFIPEVKKKITFEQRFELVENFNDYWGEKWFILPNPTYGSWLGILGKNKSEFLKGYKTNSEMEQSSDEKN